jgi:hypothetical protein
MIKGTVVFFDETKASFGFAAGFALAVIFLTVIWFSYANLFIEGDNPPLQTNWYQLVFKL